MAFWKICFTLGRFTPVENVYLLGNDRYLGEREEKECGL